MKNKLRIAIGGFRHETNTFSPIWTDYEDFSFVRGSALLESGLGQRWQGKEVELRPTFVAEALPSGLVRKATYLRLREELLHELEATLPVDGIYLDLHGAMEVEEIGDAEGNLVEGPGFNVFVRTGDTVITPARGVLEGVTRECMLELLQRENLQVKLEPLTAATAKTADEVFLTSTAGGVMPVTRISDHQVGDGRPGYLSAKLNDGYWAMHDDPELNIEVDY